MNIFEQFKANLEKYNPNIAENTVFGIFPARYIGTLCPTDDQKVLVELESNLRIYAQVQYTFPTFSVPSAEWVAANDDPLFCHIGFERGLFERPIIVGYYFKKDKKSLVPANYPREHVLEWENFEIRVNDLDEILTIKNKVSGATITISETIDMGQLAALEPAVLGDQQVTILELLIDKLGTVSGVTTPSGPSGPLSSAPNWMVVVQELKDAFPDILSPNVNLD